MTATFIIPSLLCCHCHFSDARGILHPYPTMCPSLVGCYQAVSQEVILVFSPPWVPHATLRTRIHENLSIEGNIFHLLHKAPAKTQMLYACDEWGIQDP